MVDTEIERENVHNDFGIVRTFLQTYNVPIHIGEFGVYEKADMDPRVRWTTYVARYIERDIAWHTGSMTLNSVFMIR